ncbi:50S ribosomal protein L24 [Candidatus Daviesbacteria bacterium]|nr:50S ribosomal protein L24 [Candidatus Daviesbacteria bacterium]
MTRIKKGDNVLVLLGKDRGKTGQVEKVLGKKGQLIVAGVNIAKRHVRKYRDIEGGIIDIVKPVDISNVSLICPNCKKPTRVGYEVKGDSKVRICRKCKKAI